MNKPTKEEYEKALKDSECAVNWIRIENKRQEELLDELVIIRNNLKAHKEYLEKRKEIIQTYQIYEEIENKQK